MLTCPEKEFRGRLSSRVNPPIRLKGQWEVAVTHLTLDKDQKIMVLCDLVDFTTVGDREMRFLELYDDKPATYVSVVPSVISSINIDVVRYDDNHYPDPKGDVICVLHFRKS